MKLYLISMMAALLVGAGTFTAGSTHAQSDALPQNLIGVTWNLDSIETATGAQESVTGLGLTIRFIDGSKLVGSAGCNSFFGTYKVSAGNALDISEIGSTLIGCEAPIAERETRYLSALEGVTLYSYDGSNLVLTYSDATGQGTLRYSKSGTATPGMPVAGNGSLQFTSVILGMAMAGLIAGALIVRRANEVKKTT